MKAGAGSSEIEHRAVKVEEDSYPSQCIQRGAESGGEGESRSGRGAAKKSRSRKNVKPSSGEEKSFCFPYSFL